MPLGAPGAAPVNPFPTPLLLRPPRTLVAPAPRRLDWRLAPAAAALAALANVSPAQALPPDGATNLPLILRLSRTLGPLPKGDAARRLPIVVQAREVRGRPDLETQAEGDAEFRHGGLVIRADSLGYEHPDDLARARGNVRVTSNGNRYSGPELQLKVERFEGFFLKPTYFFARTNAGGSAERIDFLGEQRALAIGATYSSCPADGSGGPAWLLSTDRVRLNFDDNEGVAEGAVLRFLGVPILAAPVLSFPLTDERKSGWLPPSIGIDSRSGVQVAVPWYWNIAPNRDATLTPSISSRRGIGLGTEFRYLEPRYGGVLRLDLLPNDRTTGRSRYALAGNHDAELARDTRLAVRVLRVSDDAYWKDFPRELPTLTPRLLLTDLQASRPLGAWTIYARALRWQVLQSSDSVIDAPYERLPQIGARTLQRLGSGFEVGAEAEFNRFTNPVGTPLDANGVRRLTASRTHVLASVARPYLSPGWSLTPKLAVNAASYSLDAPLVDGRNNGRTHVSRVIPTFSVDSAWVFERDANWFGRAMRQTLEPRLLYVNTPYRNQPDALNFDSAVKEFNFESIFSENAFSGVDRVQDAHQLTAGVTTRLLDPATGAEALRLGVAQRSLFRDQLITPDGVPLTQRFSDVLLLASSNLVPRWTLDAALQYNPDSSRVVRSILGARYSPGPYRTVNATYRLARGASEQLELGWQWPLSGSQVPGTTPAAKAVRAADDVDAPLLDAPARVASAGAPLTNGCRGHWYAVGRVNYSLRDSRVNDSIFGLEYDAGCWIGRVVAERLSTGRSEATTRLLFQLELVGLSRLGSNPLQVLKDNIPGYRLLRDGQTDVAPTTFHD